MKIKESNEKKIVKRGKLKLNTYIIFIPWLLFQLKMYVQLPRINTFLSYRATIESTLIRQEKCWRNSDRTISTTGTRGISSKFKLSSKRNVVIANTTGRRQFCVSDIWDRVGNSRWTSELCPLTCLVVTYTYSRTHSSVNNLVWNNNSGIIVSHAVT